MFSHWHWPHLLSEFCLHRLRSLIKKVTGKIIIGLAFGTWAHLLRIEQAHIDETSLAQESDCEVVSDKLVELILVLTSVLCWVPKVALNLGHYCAHCRKEWS